MNKAKLREMLNSWNFWTKELDVEKERAGKLLGRKGKICSFVEMVA